MSRDFYLSEFDFCFFGWVFISFTWFRILILNTFSSFRSVGFIFFGISLSLVVFLLFLMCLAANRSQSSAYSADSVLSARWLAGTHADPLVVSMLLPITLVGQLSYSGIWSLWLVSRFGWFFNATSLLGLTGLGQLHFIRALLGLARIGQLDAWG